MGVFIIFIIIIIIIIIIFLYRNEWEGLMSSELISWPAINAEMSSRKRYISCQLPFVGAAAMKRNTSYNVQHRKNVPYAICEQEKSWSAR